MVMMRLLQLQGSPVIGPACVRHPVLHVKQVCNNQRVHLHIYEPQASPWVNMWCGSIHYQVDNGIYYMALHPNAPHLCHPHHGTDTRPANASHQKRGVDVTAKLAGQVTMSPCCHTII